MSFDKFISRSMDIMVILACAVLLVGAVFVAIHVGGVFTECQ